MTNVIVATFPNDNAAIAAMHKLNQLDLNDDVSLYNSVLLKRKTDGNFEYLKDDRELTGWNMLGGMLVGGVIGLLGGPVGAVAGIIGGFGIGSMVDLAKFSFDYEFLDAIKDGLPYGSVALIAEVAEPNPVFVDNAFEALGAKVRRSNIYTEKDKYFQTQIDEMDAGIDELNKEISVAAAADKAKLQAKLAELRVRRDTRVAELKAVMNEDVATMKANVKHIQQTIDAKVDDAKRRRLESRLSASQQLIQKYEAQAAKFSAELAKVKGTAA